MRTRLPPATTGSAPTFLSAMTSSARYTVAYGPIVHTCPDFCWSISLTILMILFPLHTTRRACGRRGREWVIASGSHADMYKYSTGMVQAANQRDEPGTYPCYFRWTVGEVQPSRVVM